MNGPEHYRQAEQEFEAATGSWDNGDHESAEFSMAMAQMHATLALAAATAFQLADRYVGDGEHVNDWCRTIAQPTAPPRVAEEGAS